MGEALTAGVLNTGPQVLGLALSQIAGALMGWNLLGEQRASLTVTLIFFALSLVSALLIIPFYCKLAN